MEDIAKTPFIADDMFEQVVILNPLKCIFIIQFWSDWQSGLVKSKH